MSLSKCTICLTSGKKIVPLVEFPSCSLSTPHNTVCCDCYEEYINFCIHVTCGQVSCIYCRKKIKEDDLINWLSVWNTNLRNKRDMETLNQLTRQEDGFVQCYRCGTMYSVDTSTSTFITCRNHFPAEKTCVKHGAKMHEGETCNEYDRRIENDDMNILYNKMSEVYIASIVKGKCPGCQNGWQKEDEEQCDHISCCVCLMEFCGICGVDHKKSREDNSLHDKECKYHTDNLPAFPEEYLGH